MTCARRLPALVLLALLALACLGMGGFGETDIVSKIPQPDRSFTVTVVDATDTTFSATDFSVEGMTLVPVELGKANISIDFATVKTVLILDKGDGLAATVTFRDGKSKQVKLSPSTMFYGKTPWGLMRLAAKDVKEIHF